MKTAFKFFFILYIPLLITPNFSIAQCDRHGDGNKPDCIFEAHKKADATYSYKTYRDSTKRASKAIDVCELENLIIAVSCMDKKSQYEYMKYLNTFFEGKDGSLILNPKHYDLIFDMKTKQFKSFSKLSAILTKSPHQVDRTIGNQIKAYLQGKNKNRNIKASEDTRRGVVLGIILAGLGSMDDSKSDQELAVKAGDKMGGFFSDFAEKQEKISFLKWGEVTGLMHDLPYPYSTE